MCCVFIFLAPTGPPTSVTNGTITSNSITVQWGEVACLDRNGEITGYTARAMTSGRIEGTVVVNGSEMEATLTGLTPSTQYIVQVAAVNSAGSGPFSPISVYTTKGNTNIQANSYRLTILSFFFFSLSLSRNYSWVRSIILHCLRV